MDSRNGGAGPARSGKRCASSELKSFFCNEVPAIFRDSVREAVGGECAKAADYERARCLETVALTLLDVKGLSDDEIVGLLQKYWGLDRKDSESLLQYARFDLRPKFLVAERLRRTRNMTDRQIDEYFQRSSLGVCLRHVDGLAMRPVEKIVAFADEQIESGSRS